MTDLDWPAGFERTDASDRDRNRSFDVTLAQALDDLETEMDRLNAEDFRLSTAARERKTDQRPYANANPDDPGVVVRWTMNGGQYAVACDAYQKLRDNVRTVGLYVREKRKMEQRPVVTGESEFANARLPSGDDENDAVVASEPPHDVLGVSRDAGSEEVRAAFREKVQEVHPDHGGDEEAFNRVRDAREALLDE